MGNTLGVCFADCNMQQQNENAAPIPPASTKFKKSPAFAMDEKTPVGHLSDTSEFKDTVPLILPGNSIKKTDTDIINGKRKGRLGGQQEYNRINGMVKISNEDLEVNNPLQDIGMGPRRERTNQRQQSIIARPSSQQVMRNQDIGFGKDQFKRVSYKAGDQQNSKRSPGKPTLGKSSSDSKEVSINPRGRSSNPIQLGGRFSLHSIDLSSVRGSAERFNNKLQESGFTIFNIVAEYNQHDYDIPEGNQNSSFSSQSADEDVVVFAESQPEQVRRPQKGQSENDAYKEMLARRRRYMNATPSTATHNTSGARRSNSINRFNMTGEKYSIENNRVKQSQRQNVITDYIIIPDAVQAFNAMSNQPERDIQLRLQSQQKIVPVKEGITSDQEAINFVCKQSSLFRSIPTCVSVKKTYMQGKMLDAIIERGSEDQLNLKVYMFSKFKHYKEHMMKHQTQSLLWDLKPIRPLMLQEVKEEIIIRDKDKSIVMYAVFMTNPVKTKSLGSMMQSWKKERCLNFRPEQMLFYVVQILSKLQSLHSVGFTLGLLTPESVHIEISKQQIYFSDFSLLQRVKNGLNDVSGIAQGLTSSQLSKVFQYQTQVSAHTLFWNDRHILAKLIYNVLLNLKIENVKVEHLLSFINDLLDNSMKESQIYAKYDNLLLVDHNLYLPLCNQCILDGATEFTINFLNLYKNILLSTETRGKVFEKIRDDLTSNIEAQIQIEFALAQIEFMKRQNKRAISHLLLCRELISEQRMNQRKKRLRGHLTTDDILSVGMERNEMEMKVLGLLAEIHMEDNRVPRAFKSYYECLFVYFKELRSISDISGIDLETMYAKEKRVIQHLEFLVKLLKLQDDKLIVL